MLRCNGWLFGFDSRFVRHARATERANAERDGGRFGGSGKRRADGSGRRGCAAARAAEQPHARFTWHCALAVRRSPEVARRREIATTVVTVSMHEQPARTGVACGAFSLGPASCGNVHGRAANTHDCAGCRVRRCRTAARCPTERHARARCHRTPPPPPCRHPNAHTHT